MSNIFEITTQQSQILIFGWPLVDVVAIFSILALIVGWWLSSGARKESARANTLNALPIIIFEFGKDSELFIKNIGNSAATNIKIESYYHPYYDDVIERKSHIARLKFNSSAILLPDETKRVVTVAKKESVFGIELLQFSMNYPKEKLKFSVRYGDVTSKRYTVRLQVHDGHVEIVSAPRAFGAYQKLLQGTRWINEQMKLQTVARYRLWKISRTNVKTS